jgi:hypothetical protein
VTTRALLTTRFCMPMSILNGLGHGFQEKRFGSLKVVRSSSPSSSTKAYNSVQRHASPYNVFAASLVPIANRITVEYALYIVKKFTSLGLVLSSFEKWRDENHLERLQAMFSLDGST